MAQIPTVKSLDVYVVKHFSDEDDEEDQNDSGED